MLSNVSLSTFINTRAHLYPPFSIEVWGGGPGEEATLLTKKSVDPPKEHQPASKQIYDCPLEGRQVTHLRIVVTPLEKLPAWHDPNRSDERRVGKECVSPCRSRWSPYPSKTQHRTKNIVAV